MESLGAMASMKPTRGSEIPKDTSMGELWGKQEGKRGWGLSGVSRAFYQGSELSHSPVQHHQDDGPVRAQESRVLQVTAAALLGDSQSHPL